MLSLVGRRPPEPERFANAVERAADKIQRLARDPHRGLPVSDDFEAKWKDFKGEWPKVSKCVFCERGRDNKIELQVEHFRPKACVSEWKSPAWQNEALVRDKALSADPINPPYSYWWMAYEWENFALACGACNSIWKGSVFPVNGARAAVESDCRSESPLLLSPYESFDATKLFAWDGAGIIHPQTPGSRAHATVLALGLNREELRILRHKKWTECERKLWQLAEAIDADREPGLRIALESYAAEASDDADFASMARWRLNRHFDDDDMWNVVLDMLATYAT